MPSPSLISMRPDAFVEFVILLPIISAFCSVESCSKDALTGCSPSRCPTSCAAACCTSVSMRIEASRVGMMLAGVVKTLAPGMGKRLLMDSTQ